MKKTLFLLIVSIIFCTSVFSQQALWGGSEVVSPEVHGNNTVTFRLHAPNAKEVKISGDWLQQPVNMNKDEKGLWSYTTGPLRSDLYSYSFWVDSLKTDDPSNV